MLSNLTRAVAEARIPYRTQIAFVTLAVLACSWAASGLEAQQWRGRGFSRLEYVEGRPLSLDSVPIELTAGSSQQRLVGDTLVTCAPGATHCFFYRPDSVVSSSPLVLDLDVNVWGFGIEGLRAYASVRLRTALGDGEFWPRRDDNFDLYQGFVELARPRYRVRVGRDYQVSGLGFYSYDGGSLEVRFKPARAELEAYGGWGLERGVPEPADGDAFSSLGEFRPLDRNLLFGFRGSARPIAGSSIEAVYQREIETDRSGISSERIGLEANYSPSSAVWLRGHADYDLAAGWWGKAGATLGWSPHRLIDVEGRLLRYRPVFSLQTIWVAFSPVPYTGWGLALGVRPHRTLSVRLEGERRDYSDTEAGVPFFSTTDRSWLAGASATWMPSALWDVSGAYWLDFTLGAGLSAGDFRLNLHPREDVTLGARFSAFQQLEEFRIDEGRVWSIGADVRWETYLGTLYGSIARYRHDRRGNPVQTDWTQLRASLGLSFYVGSEPGRRR